MPTIFLDVNDVLFFGIIGVASALCLLLWALGKIVAAVQWARKLVK